MESEKRPITDSQIKYLTDLAGSRQMEDADRLFLLEHMKDFDTKLASKWIDALKMLPPRPKQLPKPKWSVPDVIPDGRYAILNPSKAWVFFRILTKEDRQNGLEYRIVQKILGAPGDFRYVRVTAEEWNLAITKIAVDPGLFSQMFGIQVGVCGVCGSPLTDPTSIKLGIGPICAAKYGLFGDDEADEADDE
jgi:hypothetical protein